MSADLGPAMQALFDLTGRVALVTGGSRGLGLDEACALADLGAQVIGTSRDAASAEQAARALSSHATRSSQSVADSVESAREARGAGGVFR